MEITTTHQSPQMRQLRSVLAALGQRTDPLGDYAAQAYYTLSDVAPPYPPVDPADGPTSLEAAVLALKAAIGVATTGPELSRLADASDLLREARQA